MKNKIKVTEYNFSSNNVEPTVFAFVSDLHDYPNEPVVKIIEKSGADAVLVPGDFIHNSCMYERGIDFLRMSAEMKPTFCTLGNHESKFEGDIKFLVNGTGATLLESQSYMLGGVNIGGISSGYKNGDKQSRLG